MNQEREIALQLAHQIYDDNRNLLTELKYQREYFKHGYITKQEELFNLWLFDSAIKELEKHTDTPSVPKDYIYDCETTNTIVYRNKYNGKEIHVDKNIDCGGYWIKEESPYGWDGHSYQCSECGRSIHLNTECEDLTDYPYCHCGVKMKVKGQN